MKDRLDIENETTENILFEFLGDAVQPFSMQDLFSATGLPHSDSFEKEIRQLILTFDEFVEEKNLFYPKESFLSDIPVRILPTEYEIKKGIFIPGHRLLPFYPAGMPVDEASFTCNNTPLKTKTVSMKMPELFIYFNLMDLQKIPILNFEDLLEEGADLKIKAYRIKEFYDAHKFRFGDSLIARTEDFSDGQFSLEYESLLFYKDHIFEIEKSDRAFLKTLKKVLKKDLFYPNVEKQLLYTYFYLKQNKQFNWAVPLTALGSLLQKDKDITFSPLPNGRTIFHFVSQSPDDLAVYPDFEDLLESGDDEFDLETIDGILSFLNNNNGITIVRALLFDMVTENRRFNYPEIENYLFDGLQKPYMPKEFRKRFRALVQEEYRKIKQKFDLKYAYLPITTARQKILEQSLVISQFLRSLDEQMVGLDELPKNEMMHLMELYQAFEEILIELDTSQISGECDSTEVHRIVKIVNRISGELPRLFDVIRGKLDL
jgi:hypothetical protein